MNKAVHQYPIWERCPYLGLHDDSSTSLSYASPWNYCYRSDVPDSILAAHQGKVCLTRHYSLCTVYHSEALRRLPRELRGKSNLVKLGVRSSMQVVRWVEFLLLLALLILVLFFAQELLP